MRFELKVYDDNNRLVDEYKKHGHYAILGVSVIYSEEKLVATNVNVFNKPQADNLMKTNLAMSAYVSDYNCIEKLGTTDSLLIGLMAQEMFAEYEGQNNERCDCDCCNKA